MIVNKAERREIMRAKLLILLKAGPASTSLLYGLMEGSYNYLCEDSSI